ncbi:MAG: peptide deformylase [Actinomycetota bacterium]
MSLSINKLGDPVLRCPSKTADFQSDELQEIVSKMWETLEDVRGLGLAGPQIGILKRIFVYDLGEGREVLINPEIVWQSDETVEDTEGCLSIPDSEMKVTRAAKIRIKGLDLEAREREIEAEGLTARVFQHEMDHLNGIMIIDRTSDEERREVMKKIIGRDRR